MGIYINPGNESFATVRRGRYVDKSGLIAVVNKTLDTRTEKLSLVSRPRRFGKSIAVQMLCAYYCTGCDSSALFEDLAIANGTEEERAEYRKYLNQYNVLLLDITGFSENGGLSELPKKITEAVTKDYQRLYPGVTSVSSLAEILEQVQEKNGKKFIALIDEWDAPMRDSSATPAVQKEYLEFLRSLFKNANITDKIFAGAYMTGILPMRMDGSQSAISEFNEYTILHPGPFAPYVGFSEGDVKMLCEETGMDFTQMKSWYDGYSFRDIQSVYNPNSVMKAIRSGYYESYWQMSSAADNLLSYISMDFDGLEQKAADLIAGKTVGVKTRSFKNDLVSFATADDVMTLLIHFGYLSYDEEGECVRIPNREIRGEFEDTLMRLQRPDTMLRVKESAQLIEDTINREADKVAAQIEKVHREEWEPRFYNNEQALRGVIKLAYFCYRDSYAKMEELASGKGYADIAFIPIKGRGLPALVIELKWKKDVHTAIDQIRDNDYPDALKNFADEILLVGVSYDKEDGEKKHHCIIEALNTPEED